jgi:hypothetical protein
MGARVGFVICTERGRLERLSILFARSLRRWGGSLRDAPVLSVQPRRGLAVSRRTAAKLAAMGVDHRSVILNKDYRDVPFANKALTAAYAEGAMDADCLVFADSDQMVLGEPCAFLLPDACDVMARPVDHKGAGAEGPDDPNYPYWEKLYRLAGVSRREYVETLVDRRRILGYWQGGLVGVRRQAGVFSRWSRVFRAAIDGGAKPSQGVFYVEQSALSSAMLAASGDILPLPPAYNYPIHAHARLPEAMRITRLRDLVTIHYHRLFERRCSGHPLAPFMADDELSRWVCDALREEGLFPQRGMWGERLSQAAGRVFAFLRR